MDSVGDLHSAHLLNYERQIVQDLIQEDALCVMSAGMGWQKIAAVLVQLHAHSQPGAVLILGCQPWQKEIICREVVRHNSAVKPPLDINNEVPALERIECYKKPDSFFVTTRILVVDFLSARVLPQNIAGMIVLNAHRVTEASGDAFAVRLYRAGNRTGFIRAISDQPCSFVSGFNKVEKVMRLLHVRRLALWPRFHQYVRDEIDAGGSQVVEWGEALSPAMQHIQAAITDILDALIKDLKRTNNIDCSDLVLENGLSRSFEDIVRRQLDPIWHTINAKTRQICRDLRTLRQLALHLVRHDAVTFLSYLESLRATEGRTCVWLFHDATHTLFEMARRRVYIYRQSDNNALSLLQQEDCIRQKADVPDKADAAVKNSKDGVVEVSASTGQAARRKRKTEAVAVEGTGPASGVPKPPVLEVVLEEVPKWGLLVEVLKEVHDTRTAWAVHSCQEKQVTAPSHPPSSRPGAHLEKPVYFAGDHDEVVDLSTQQPEGIQAVWAASSPPQMLTERPRMSSHDCLGEEGTSSRGPCPPQGEASTIRAGPDAASFAEAAASPILVIVREPHMCVQLEQVVRLGGRAVMQAMYEAFVTSSIKRGGGINASWAGGTSQVHHETGVSGEGRGRGSAGGKGWGRSGRGRGVRNSEWSQLRDQHAQGGPGPAWRPGEQQALKEEAARLEQQRRKSSSRMPGQSEFQGTSSSKKRSSDTAESGDVKRRLKKKHRDDSPPPVSPPKGTDLESSTHQQLKIRPATSRQANAITCTSEAPEGMSEAAKIKIEDAGSCPLLSDVHFYALDSKQDDILWQIRPSCIIFYEPDLAFIRQVEQYQAERCTTPLSVHILTYDDSLEGQAHLAAVERERQALTSLIEFKQHIVIPTDLEPGQQLELWTPSSTGGAVLDSASRNQLTRQGGALSLMGANGGTKGGLQKQQQRRLVVDVREFMSGLPSVLHQKGMMLMPVTLEVGDYVLSPEICVERKALPDLQASLASGRLYHQAEAMTKHYKTPILLIEFDPARAFSLQSVHDIGDDIDARSITSKLALLILHFPRLKLVWSRSPHATADVFMDLKRNQDEPDSVAAALVGIPVGAGGLALMQPGGSPLELVVNQSAQDLIRKLPGVTEANFRPLMTAMGSLRALADASIEEIEAAMGGSGNNKNAKLLKEFMDAPCPRL
ncbi:hypothetical protein CEUSTIGMA_g12284.t1 [Chlamydomonas eustigma]|uniref:ERCC4 domain-containing protein n=1 Tax=Chlamydomonas eustigma TaxID=1157962 RepID=A0A250XPD6_9CHLO|nr:hypothetical protein CEUSTIGMA_g12284.t1 [Chlamydomonas eustigma]|eukprot:GAX84863.1 hypothetical protein CEUSTIGMA_g12284.t1 [Chlamydomonas eustigma]